MRRHPNVINIDEVEPWASPTPPPAPFACADRHLSTPAGSKAIGCSHYRVPAGKTAFPAHAHHINEEAIFVLEGQGTLRVGEQRVAVRAGDWIALPPGEAHAHQLLADQGVELAYLCLSTTIEADIVTYPDSGKLLATAGPFEARTVRKMFWQRDAGVPYFAGEGEPGEGQVP